MATPPESGAPCQSSNRERSRRREPQSSCPSCQLHSRRNGASHSALCDRTAEPHGHRSAETTPRAECVCSSFRALYARNHAGSRATLAANRDTIVSSRATLADIRDPSVSSRATLADTRDPSVSSRATLADIRDPSVSSRATLADTRVPSVSSRATLADNRDPSVSSRATLADTRDPSVSSRATLAATDQCRVYSFGAALP
jgi:hypothetical protein